MNNYVKIGAIASVLTISMHLFSSNSVAKTPTIIAQKSCEKLTTTIEQKKCYEKAFYQAEKKLDIAFNRLKTMMENDPSRAKERQKALLDSQEKWLKYRDSNCYFRSSGWG
ncbi:MAG TPA: lysozyme inhibitor LprI family protein, partial [Allocoleopsis sp.]